MIYLVKREGSAACHDEDGERPGRHRTLQGVGGKLKPVRRKSTHQGDRGCMMAETRNNVLRSGSRMGRPVYRRTWKRWEVHGKDGMGLHPYAEGFNGNLCEGHSTNVDGESIRRMKPETPFPKMAHSRDSVNHLATGHRFRSDRSGLTTVCQKAVTTNTKMQSKWFRTHEEPATRTASRRRG